jgi:hypothetical protein
MIKLKTSLPIRYGTFLLLRGTPAAFVTALGTDSPTRVAVRRRGRVARVRDEREPISRGIADTQCFTSCGATVSTRSFGLWSECGPAHPTAASEST